LQTRPNFHPEGTKFEESKRVSAQKATSSKPIIQLWHLKGRCPEGTIPIRRTKKEDVLRASSVERFGKKKPTKIPHQPRSAQPDLITQTGHQVRTSKLYS
jgi:hypothetical protein